MKYAPEELPDRCAHLIGECLYVASVYQFQAELWESYAYDDEDANRRITRKRHREQANRKAARKAQQILEASVEK